MITRISPDKQKSEALKKMAEITLERLKETEIVKYPSNTVNDYYDVIHKLMEAITLAMGIKFKSEGAHQELIDYVSKTCSLGDQTRQFLQEMRDYRNRISYEGFMISQNYITLNQEKIKNIIKTLQEYNSMKVILVDAVNTFVIKDKGIFQEMYKLLEKYPNKKIILTNANDEEMKTFRLNDAPYEVFTLKHNPNKTDPEFFKIMLKHFNLTIKDVIYFEHNPDAVKSAQSVGIVAFHYNKDKKDLTKLKKFIDTNLYHSYLLNKS